MPCKINGTTTRAIPWIFKCVPDIMFLFCQFIGANAVDEPLPFFFILHSKLRIRHRSHFVAFLTIKYFFQE